MSTTLIGYNIKLIKAGYYEVVSPQKRAYTVNLNVPDCDCADFIYRGEKRPCKHIGLVRIAIERGSIPALSKNKAPA